MKETTLIYIYKEGKYLFLLRNKKENDINKDKYIGVGGHLEKGESHLDCVRRETYEETGRHLKTELFLGTIIFNNTCCESELMYLYTGEIEEGTLKECNEGTFCWVKKEGILKLNLWEGDKLFLPYLNNVNKKPFKMILNYDGNTLLSSEGPIFD